MDENIIKKFRHYQPVKKVNTFIKSNETYDIEENSILKTIFAPDPLTGKPRSDLALVMNAKASPEVAQFIKNNLMTAQSRNNPAPDADLALMTLQERNETRADYMMRLQQIAQKYAKSDKKENKETIKFSE